MAIPYGLLLTMSLLLRTLMSLRSVPLLMSSLRLYLIRFECVFSEHSCVWCCSFESTVGVGL